MLATAEKVAANTDGSMFWQIAPLRQTRYPVIVEPPSELGADHSSRTVPALGLLAVTEGADGTVRAALVRTTAADLPSTVIAATETS